jgi:hypothetical protein
LVGDIYFFFKKYITRIVRTMALRLAALLAAAALPLSLSSSAAAAVTAADRGGAVVVGNARFTATTSSLLRLELANSAGQFDDHPSLVMSSKDQLPEPPPFTVERPSSTSVIVTTEHLVLRYTASSERRG